MSELTLAQVTATFERRYPLHTAESWDAVGLVAGDPAAPVRKIMFAMDPVRSVVDEAIEWGADLLITHHPLYLKGVTSVAASTAKGAVVHRLLGANCALYTAHTNGDVADGGVSEALAQALGLVDIEPLVAAAGPAMDKHVVFVPVEPAGTVDRVISAMADAGAGSMGHYSRCSWRTTGLGSFLPGADAQPAVGEVGTVAEVVEARVEMVAPRSARNAVIGAMRHAHPYEEPAFDVLETAQLPAKTGIGRIGRLPDGESLRTFADRVAAALPATEQGVRVAGDLNGTVRTVAVCGGSGDSYLGAAQQAGVDAYVTADLRHHPASEARENATGPGGDGRPYLVDVAHFASEWPWLNVAAQLLTADLSAAGATVDMLVSKLRTDPWDLRVASTAPEGA